MKFVVSVSMLLVTLLGVIATGEQKQPVSSKYVAAGAVAGTGAILGRPVGVINKNSVIFGNNVFIARSRLVFTQDDRFALVRKVEKELKKEAVGTAVLTKNVMRIVSAPTTDTALMSKAAAVVAARGGDMGMLSQKITDFVDTAAKKEMEREAKHEAALPQNVMVLIGTKSILSQPAAVVNKNVAFSDNQMRMSRSKIAPTKNDQVMLQGDAKVAGVIAPQSRMKFGSISVTETTKEKEGAQYRTAFLYRLREGKQGHKECFGGIGCGLGLGWGLGWRYPLGWWGRFGGGCSCGLGIAAGPWFFC